MNKSNNIAHHVTKLKNNLGKILFYPDESKNIDFYISALTEYNPYNSTDEIVQWLEDMNKLQYFHVDKIAFNEFEKWRFHDWTGDLYHETNGFFTICGLKVKTNIGKVNEWSQPIINQPEIGVLGIIAKKINGVLYFLMQAKAEPGNINTFQISPTVQATRSNYLRLHGGKPTRFLDFFLDDTKSKVLIDQLQSEQGARFYRKRNRNIIVEVPETCNIELTENFKWLTIGQLLHLTKKDNFVNMDTRSVISAIDFAPEYAVERNSVNEEDLISCIEESALISKRINKFGIKLMISSHPNSRSLHSMDDILLKMTKEKFKCILDTKIIPLNEVRGWKKNEHEIYHDNRKYFSVIGVRVTAADREVPSWDQPIIEQKDSGIIGFITKEIDGVLHFLIQLKLESGVMDLLEISPTVQCITDNYSHESQPPFVKDFLDRDNMETVFDVFQSEEGGRFYRESNENILLFDKENKFEELNSKYIFMTLKQLKQLVKFNNFLNVEARSLLACMEWN